MKLLSNAMRRIRQATGKQLIVGFALVLALSIGGLVGTNSFSSSGKVDAACAGDPSANSIIKCGEPSRAAFISAVRGSSELQHIYAHFGLSASDYDRFISSAQPGVAYDNNTIVVNGSVVATSVGSVGRLASYQGSGYKTFPIAGAGTYYGNYNSKAFASGTHALPVDVLFDAQGKVQFAVMTGSCANPTYQTPVTPTYACNELQPTSLGNNQWSFTTSASAGHGATISKLVYDFGDGSAPVTTTSPATAVHHTFTKDSSVTVTVYVSLPGGGTVKLSGGNCVKNIKYTSPAAVLTCQQLNLTPGKVDSEGNAAFTLSASATASHASITSYTFAYGDGSSKAIATSATSASATHTYAPGSYTATVTVAGTDLNGKVVTAPVSAACKQPITVTPPQPKSPGINLTKTVDGQKYEQVAAGQQFTYQLIINNTGQNTLTNAVVSDPAPAGVTMLSADLGTVTNNSFSYTIPSLAVGQSITVNITAVVNTYVAGNLVNTACVNAPAVNPNQPTQPDSCDTATVTVTPPAVVTPPETTTLVNTGAGNVIGLFGVSIVLGSLGYHFFLSRRLRQQ